MRMDTGLQAPEGIDSIDGLRRSAGPIAFLASTAFVVLGVVLHFEAIPHPPFAAYAMALVPIGVLFLLRAESIRTLTIAISPILLGVWIFLSNSWTEDPERTAFLVRLQLPLLLGFMIMGAVLSEKDTMRWLLNAVRLVVLVSLAATIAIPSTRAGVLLNGEVLDGWHGLFPHKNDLGPFLAIGLGVVVVADKNRWTRWTIIAVIGLLLLGSQSVTGLTAAMVGVAAHGWLRANARADDRVLTIAVVATSILAITAALGTRTGLPIFLDATGKDPTFSGRTEIWSAVWGAIVDRPILGYGRGGLFFPPGNDISIGLWREIGFRAPHAHNGVLDVWSQLGIIGLVLYAIVFGTTLRSAIRSFRRGEQFGSFTLVFIATLLVASLSEPVFLGPYLSIMAMLRVVSIRLDRVATLQDLAELADPVNRFSNDLPGLEALPEADAA